jgi:hypothetical protein
MKREAPLHSPQLRREYKCLGLRGFRGSSDVERGDDDDVTSVEDVRCLAVVEAEQEVWMGILYRSASVAQDSPDCTVFFCKEPTAGGSASIMCW